jgi:hypothetical protein
MSRKSGLKQGLVAKSDITQARKALVARILEGDASASHAQRRAAFDNAGLAEPLSALIEKVAKHAHQVTDEDIIAAREHRQRLLRHRPRPVARRHAGAASGTCARFGKIGDTTRTFVGLV